MMEFSALFVFMWSVYTVESLLSIIALPSSILPDLTEHLIVNCTYRAGSDPNITSLISLTISRSIGQSPDDHQEIIGSVNSFSGVTSSQANLTAAGVIDNTGQSFLSFVWNGSTGIRQGTYFCNVSGLDTTGQPLTFSSSVNVSGVGPESDLLRVEMLKLKKYVDDLKISLQSYNMDWSRRLENAKNSLFEISEVHNGSQYFLYKESPSSIPGVAQATCEIYSGQLAEIGDGEEYDYIISFIQRFSWVRFLLVGGSQYGEVNNWVYPHSNQSLEYFRWAVPYPWYSMDYDCIVLSDVYGWNMTNQLCSIDQSQWPIHYLCEVQV